MQTEVQRTGRVQSGDVSLHYRAFGRPGKTPLLIAHGMSYFSYDWIPAAEALSRDREIVAADTRGFGESDWSPSGDNSIPTLARDVMTLVDHFGWKQVILIGHSMSGRSTSLAAADNPARVLGLALIDFTPENAAAGGKRVAQKVGSQPDVFPSIDAAMLFFDVDPASDEGRAKRARFEAYLKPVSGGFQLKRDLHYRNQFKRQLESGEKPKPGIDMWEVIGRVQCPILSMRGARSDMYAPETKAKMIAANPRVSVVEVDAGHNIAGENLAGFLGALRPFLKSAGVRDEQAA